MRILTMLPVVTLLPNAARADFGHLGELAGHDHIIAGVAVGAAILVGLIGLLKGDDEEESLGEPEADAEPDTPSGETQKA